MTRSARISWDLTDAWEVWNVDIPDDAPNPLTVEWVQDNLDKIEFVTQKDSGYGLMTNPVIDWETDD